MFEFVRKLFSSNIENKEEYPEYSFKRKCQTSHCNRCNRDVRNDEMVTYYDVWTYFLCPHCGNTIGWRSSVL